eukprot:637145-Alexandrium_andersonii.AAC.1
MTTAERGERQNLLGRSPPTVQTGQGRRGEEPRPRQLPEVRLSGPPRPPPRCCGAGALQSSAV